MSLFNLKSAQHRYMEVYCLIWIWEGPVVFQKVSGVIEEVVEAIKEAL